MINVSLFFKTFSNFAVFLLLFAFGSAWSYYCLKREKNYTLTPVIIISALLLVAWGMVAAIDIDEVEHLHCSWMTYSGLIPFKDFWQHHAPLLWIVLAPVFGILKPSAWVFDLSRIFSGLVFVLIIFTGWKVSRKVWGAQARLSMYLLIVFASSIMGEFLCLRPDLFATLFLLFFINFSLEIPGQKVSSSFFAGASFGLAASFIFKQYLLFFLPIYIILREKSGSRMAKISAYLMGVCFGALPLMFYLLDKGIFREFIFWVFSYNRKRIIFSAEYPLAVAAVGIWGMYLLFRRYRAIRDTKAFAMVVAFCLSSVSSLTHTLPPFYSYNMGLWFLLCAITGSSQSIQSLTGRLSSLRKRSLATGLFLSLILSFNIVALSIHKYSYFSTDKKVISELIRYAAQDTCLVILPYHPIFAFDASRLYSFWQFRLSENYPELKEDITSRGMAQEVQRRKPAIVLGISDDKDFLRELLHNRLISRNDFHTLSVFFQTGYTIKIIGRNAYFIRNDKL